MDATFELCSDFIWDQAVPGVPVQIAVSFLNFWLSSLHQLRQLLTQQSSAYDGTISLHHIDLKLLYPP